MDYQLKFLHQNQTTEMHQCMMEAFVDYAVDMSYMTHERMINRYIKNGVDYGVSVGAYFEDKMIGFTAIGVDDWQGQKAAFDAGTGIVAAHRGKGLAKKMFDFAKEKLIQNNIRKFVLEVLKVNEPAIKAYKKTGFNISRSFDFFNVKLENIRIEETNDIEIRELLKDELQPLEHFVDWHPSWENSFNSIQRIPNELIITGAFHKNECIGFQVFYPHLEWVMMIAVKNAFRRQKIGTMLMDDLFKRTYKNHAILKLNNSISEDKGFYDFVTACGFEYIGGQYEMEMNL